MAEGRPAQWGKRWLNGDALHPGRWHLALTKVNDLASPRSGATLPLLRGPETLIYVRSCLRVLRQHCKNFSQSLPLCCWCCSTSDGLWVWSGNRLAAGKGENIIHGRNIQESYTHFFCSNSSHLILNLRVSRKFYYASCQIEFSRSIIFVKTLLFLPV